MVWFGLPAFPVEEVDRRHVNAGGAEEGDGGEEEVEEDAQARADGRLVDLAPRVAQHRTIHKRRLRRRKRMPRIRGSMALRAVMARRVGTAHRHGEPNWWAVPTLRPLSRRVINGKGRSRNGPVLTGEPGCAFPVSVKHQRQRRAGPLADRRRRQGHRQRHLAARAVRPGAGLRDGSGLRPGLFRLGWVGRSLADVDVIAAAGPRRRRRGPGADAQRQQKEQPRSRGRKP